MEEPTLEISILETMMRDRVSRTMNGQYCEMQQRDLRRYGFEKGLFVLAAIRMSLMTCKKKYLISTASVI